METPLSEFESFKTRMMLGDPTISHVFDRGDGTCLIVKRLLFHWTLLVNVVGEFGGYEDRWCYQTQDLALEGAQDWYRRDYEGEPVGWHRHHKTGRRRPGGDPEKEYIQH